MAKTQFSSHPTSLSYKRLLGSVVALVAFLLLLTSVIGLAEKYFAIKERTRELKSQQVALEEKEAALMEQNAYLATPDGQKQTLRAKFNVVQPGEEMIVIMTPPEVAPSVPEHQSRLEHWWSSIIRGIGLHS